jgi:tyrosinase-like protein
MLPAVANHQPRVGATVPNPNPNPNLPTPANLANLTQFSDVSALSSDQALQNWHGNVHGTMGGAMAYLDISPCAAVFWTWHAFIDDIFEDWLEVRRWNWTNLGKPPGVNIRAALRAVTVVDAASSAQRPQVFVEGNDYNHWVNWRG